MLEIPGPCGKLTRRSFSESAGWGWGASLPDVLRAEELTGGEGRPRRRSS